MLMRYSLIAQGPKANAKKWQLVALKRELQYGKLGLWKNLSGPHLHTKMMKTTPTRGTSNLTLGIYRQIDTCSTRYTLDRWLRASRLCQNLAPRLKKGAHK
jgi:hypothetical protein